MKVLSREIDSKVLFSKPIFIFYFWEGPKKKWAIKRKLKKLKLISIICDLLAEVSFTFSVKVNLHCKYVRRFLPVLVQFVQFKKHEKQS